MATSSKAQSDVQPSNKSILGSVKERLDDIRKGASMHNGWRFTTNTSAFSKSAVCLLDPNDGRCIITGELPSESTLDCAHLFARRERKNKALLLRLEKRFGLPQGSLNIDDALNLIYVRRDLHAILDNNRGIVLPDPDMVDLIKGEHQTSSIDITKVYGGRKTFYYRFFPLAASSLTSITHWFRSSNDAEQAPSAQTKFEVFHSPFVHMPKLESHAQPHWVILNAGEKLAAATSNEIEVLATRIVEADGGTLEKAKDFLQSILALYYDWTGLVPKTSPDAKNYAGASTTGGTPGRGPDDDAAKGKRKTNISLASVKNIGKNLMGAKDERKRSTSSHDAASSLRSPLRKGKRGRVSFIWNGGNSRGD